MNRQPEWFPVAVWELLRMIKRKDFLFSVLLAPALVLVVIAAVLWIRRYEATRWTKLAVVQAEPRGIPEPLDRPGSPAATDATLPPLEGFEWVIPPPGQRDPEALKRQIRERKVEGAVWLPADRGGPDSVRVLARQPTAGWRQKLAAHLTAEARRVRAAERGIDTAELARIEAPVPLRIEPVDPRARTSRGDRLVAVMLSFLLLMSLFGTNAYMMIGITGEKQARMTEVIVSAIRPQSWMDGKIAAFTLLGVVQATLWIAALAAVAVAMRWPLPAIRFGVLASAGVYTAIGLVFYTSLYALVLATIKDVYSTSKFQAYLLFLPMLPLVFIEPVLDSPDGAFAVIASLIPLFSPILMPARIAVGAAAGWEVAVGLAALALSAHAMRRAAGHAFRIGMLMYGKELTLPELWRWSREK